MVYTSFRFVFRWSIRIYLFFLILHVIHSIYQATFITSAHNRGEIVDHGAEILQDIFEDLRMGYPRFDYFVKTVNQVFLQLMMTVALRYKINTAVWTGGFVAFAVVASIFVVGKLVVWVVREVQELVYCATCQCTQLLEECKATLEDNLRWAGEILWYGGEIKRSFHTKTHSHFTESFDGSSEAPRRTGYQKVWKWTSTPDDDGSHSEEEDNGSATGEAERTPEPDHKQPSSTSHAPKRAHSAPPRSAEVDPDQKDRHRTGRAEKDHWHWYGTADSIEVQRNGGSRIWVSLGPRTEAMEQAAKQAAKAREQAAKTREQAAKAREQAAMKREQQRKQAEEEEERRRKETEKRTREARWRAEKQARDLESQEREMEKQARGAEWQAKQRARMQAEKQAEATATAPINSSRGLFYPGIGTSFLHSNGGKGYRFEVGEEYVELEWHGEQTKIPSHDKPIMLRLHSDGFEVHRGDEILWFPENAGQLEHKEPGDSPSGKFYPSFWKYESKTPQRIE